MRNTTAAPIHFMPGEQPPRLIALKDVPRLKWLSRRRQGKKLHASTLWRWALHGQHGVKLHTVRVGGSIATTESWLRDFFEQLSAATNPSDSNAHVTAPTSRAREKQISQAESELAAAGFEIGSDQEK